MRDTQGIGWAGLTDSGAETAAWKAAGWEPHEYAALYRMVTIAAEYAHDTWEETRSAQQAGLAGWRTSGIPAHLALAYARAGYTPTEAADIETGNQGTSEDTLAALAALSALGAGQVTD